MNISSRCEYACRAILELAAKHGSNGPITATDIAAERDIPEKYLVHILLQLKRAGIVRSIRGPQGGYLLTRPPEAITAADIVQAIDGPVLDPLPVADREALRLAPVWRRLGRRIQEVLEQVTVRDMLQQATPTEMYYI